jgi:ubiquinone/menaquinone biosynthesis C-methylase UbiE
MVDYHQIYAEQADAYDRLVGAEDWRGNLPRIIKELIPLQCERVLEVGAGTGRLTRMLPQSARIVATEASEAMLRVAATGFDAGRKIGFCTADARALPVRDGWADVAIAGWVFGHFCDWHPQSAEAEIDNAIGEMRRCLRAGGTAVILETLGTGTPCAGAPTPGLECYYRRMEDVFGFVRSVVETDYEFADRPTAEELVTFFFGEETARRIGGEARPRLREFTGVWTWTDVA